ncbi:MAG: glycosyltransferase [Rikenellaceae bacterium]
MKISVIIPIYCVEEWVEKCINSIIDQGGGDIELIVVDDASTDNSMQIVQRLLSDVKFSVVYITHEVNRGLSAARNSGIRAASGDYIYFLDSDDMLAPNALNSLLEATTNECWDVIVGNYKVLSEEGSYVSQRYNKRAAYDNNDQIVRAFVDGYIPVMAWNKLVKREYLSSNNLMFMEGVLHEDELWSFKLITTSEKLLMLGDTTYLYNVRQGSIMTTPEIVARRSRSMIDIFAQMTNIYISKNRSSIIASYLERFAFQCYLQAKGFKLYKEIRDIQKQIKIGCFSKASLLRLHLYLPKEIGYLCSRAICKLYMLK